jgi:iron complex outermembrane receptor protein
MKPVLTIFILLYFFFSLSSFVSPYPNQESYEIEVLGKKIPLNFDTKRGVLVIEGETLREFPAANLAQVLSFAANMNVVSRGNFQADPQIMGFNQEQIVVMINGMPMNNAQTGHHNFSLPLEMEDIERIEILRGGYSTLAGYSGTGGLINIITTGRKSVKLRRASFNGTNLSLNWNSEHAYVSGGRLSTDGYLEGTDGNKAFAQIGARFAVAKSHFDIWGGWLRNSFGAANFYAPFPSYEKLQRFLGGLNWHMPLSPGFSLVSKFTSQYTNDEFTLFRENPESYLNSHRTAQGSLEIGVRGAGRALSYYAGASAYLDSINSDGLRNGEAAAALGIHSRQLYAIFAEFTTEKDRVFMNVGGRFSFGTYEGFSGQMLVGYQINETLRASASIYRNFRIPTYTELFYSDIAHAANPDLNPETSLGGAFNLDHFWGGWEWGVKVFANRSRNLIDWGRSSVEDIWVSENIRMGRYYGLDLKLHRTSGSGACKFLYTWQKASFENDGDSQQLKYHFYFPEHSFSVILVRSFKHLALSTALKSETESSTKKTRVYVNARISRDIGRAKIYFEILNLFNHQIERIPGLPEAPRSYALGLRFDLGSARPSG